MNFVKSILLTLSLLVFGQSAFAQATKNVNVVNIPDVNVVSIPAVTVSNMPATQAVDGTVSIGNTPDVNVIFTPYFDDVICEVLATNLAGCYFDVPAGYVLQIESVSGFMRMGRINFLTLQVVSVGSPGSKSRYIIPNVFGPQGTNWIFGSEASAYANDGDMFTDELGAKRDFRILVSADAGSFSGAIGRSTVIGRLFPAP